MAAAFHSLRCSQYADYGLAAFAKRLNRRFDLTGASRASASTLRADPENGPHAEAGFSWEKNGIRLGCPVGAKVGLMAKPSAAPRQ